MDKAPGGGSLPSLAALYGKGDGQASGRPIVTTQSRPFEPSPEGKGSLPSGQRSELASPQAQAIAWT